MTRRILLVSPYSFDAYGGVQQQVDGIATALARRGEEVVVLAPGEGAEKERNGYRYIPASRSISVPTNGSRAPIAPTPAAYTAVRRALQSVDPTVVHVHEPLTPGPSLFSIWAYDGPIVGTFHRSRSGWIYPLYGRVSAASVRKITIDTVVSDAARATAVHALGRSLGEPIVVPNGIAAATVTHTARPTTDRPRILFVGRHERRKGLAVLLEAFCGLAGDVELQVIGTGGETDELKRRYSDPRIAWLGPVDDDEKHRRLRSADLFVAPSLGGESFGVVLLEALAGTTAVIASDLPGYREAGGDAVIYVPPGDPDALREQIEFLLSDPGERQLLATTGAQRAKGFDFAIVAATYLDLYDRAIEVHQMRKGTRASLRRLRP